MIRLGHRWSEAEWAIVVKRFGPRWSEAEWAIVVRGRVIELGHINQVVEWARMVNARVDHSEPQ
ncbi:hypothetical protein Hamer_G024864 [Homarus americanus]|uniref:Uncharacterized protein n=1 Tax=Homarus americanus TaxID=6706 RepID=A0A8J5MZK9_HOMAM|nr:hypothetical protein Hamer_G024864 [Homarus americanus]